MIYKILLSASFMLFLGCLGTEQNTTEYKTNYTLNLNAIDPELSLDSAHIEVFIDGKLDTSYTLKSPDLSNPLVSLKPIFCSEEAEIEVRYTVYSGGEIVSDGSDLYKPDSGETNAKPIDVRESTIQKLLSSKKQSSATESSSLPESSTARSSTAKNSSMEPSSSSVNTPISSVTEMSSSTTANIHTITFVTASSTAIENGVAGSVNFPTILLRVEGPKGSTLPEDHDVSLIPSGSAKSTDYTITKSVIKIPANSAVGDEFSISLVLHEDALVEGPETITLTLSDSKGGTPTIESHTITLNDADSAWVHFEQDSAKWNEDVGSPQTFNVQLTTKPSSAKLANSVQVKVSANAQGTTAVMNDDYTIQASTLTFFFQAGQGNGESHPLTITPKDYTGWNENTQIEYELSVLDGRASVSGEHLFLKFLNTDYEYFAVLWNDGAVNKVSLFNPNLDLQFYTTINDGTLDIMSVTGLVLSQNKDKVFAVQKTGGLYSYDALNNNWIMANSFAGPHEVRDGGLCSDGKFTAIYYKMGSVYYNLYSSPSNLSASYLDQATIQSGSYPPIHYRPCIPSSLGGSGGLVLTDTKLLKYSLNEPIATETLKDNFVNASAMAMLKTDGIVFSEVAYVLDGTDLWTIGVYSTAYDGATIDLKAKLGAAFTGAIRMVETPRKTLILIAADQFYEINPKTGNLIHSADHGMNAILDAEFITNGNVISIP